jgi:hypothetical protein
MGLTGSVFRTLEELQLAAVGLPSSRRRKNEERSKQFIENLRETSSQKSEKISFRVGFFKLSPCFAVDNHISTMNPCWQHILRRPNLQDLRRPDLHDLRRFKFTRKIV